MEKQLIALFLDEEFYQTHKAQISEDMFPDELNNIWNTIIYAHEKYKRTISFAELSALFLELNPVLSRAAKNVILEVLSDVEETSGDIKADVGTDLVKELYRQTIGRRIANYGLEVAEGKTPESGALVELQQLLDSAGSSTKYISLPREFDDVLSGSANRPCWKFNLSTLYAQIPGIAPGDFGVIFARPEAGKTAFYISLVAGPDGFLWQGAKVLLITNEEPGIKTLMRMVSAATGMTYEQVFANREEAKTVWNKIKDNLVVIDDATLSTNDLHVIAATEKPDIIIVDQMDKIDIKGTFARTDERLQDLYIESRKLAKIKNCAVIAVTQCGAEGEGKTVLTFNMMDNSKTGKAANADLILGLGKPNQEDGTENNVRHIYVSKNKINGYHGKILALLRPELSRYTA